MCVTFVWINDSFVPGDPRSWQLVLINNRDEHYKRPTSPADWKNEILCSRDLESGKEGGTWLGMNSQGHMAFLHNINFPVPKNVQDLKGRGNLVLDYLHQRQQDETTALDYCTELAKNGTMYNGFSLVLIDRNNDALSNNIENSPWRLVYYTNREGKGVELLRSGFHGFGNCPVNAPFKKVQKAKDKFKNVCSRWAEYKNVDYFVNDLLDILKDKEQCFPDSQMEKYQPALTAHLVQCMSSSFVEFPAEYGYGTRTHTVILIDGTGDVTYLEQNLDDPKTKHWSTRKYLFHLQKNCTKRE